LSSQHYTLDGLRRCGSPAMASDVDAVVVAALHRGSEVLLCHRSPNRRWYPNVWDFPGGHVEESESLRAALVRELREELAVEVAQADVAAQPHWQVVATDFHMSVWRIDSWAGEPVNTALDEHDEIQWFGLTEALALPLAHPAYPALLRELAGVQRMP